jgi:hypothetical protein
MEIFNFLYFRVYLCFRFLTVFFFFKRLFFERFVRRRDLPPFFYSEYPLSTFFCSATLFVCSATAQIKNIVFFDFYDKYIYI